MTSDWQPSCSLRQMQERAQLLQSIRKFFQKRSLLEVETPILGQAIGSDPNLDFFQTEFNWMPNRRRLFLQTSPEFAMKRLLAAGSGSIFQICKAFRNGESGRYHNPEFTLLEWYRVGFGLEQLMDECDELIRFIFNGYRSFTKTERSRYQDVFLLHTGLNALEFSYPLYSRYAEQQGITEAISLCGQNHSLWLDLLFSHKVQPNLGKNALCMIYDYPACQASLARLNPANPNCTERVELFIDGVELGNGYHELTEADEQEHRFDQETSLRKQQHQPGIVKDKRLLAALEYGLPDCAGMALGLDRVLMVRHQLSTIEEVLNFPVRRA